MTERSNIVPKTPENAEGYYTVSVQCNSDEVVTGGGHSHSDSVSQSAFPYPFYPVESKRQGNGWTVTWFIGAVLVDLKAYAECLKIVNEEGTAG